MAKRFGISKGLIVNREELQSILQSMGEQLPSHSRLVLIGGSALILLGSPRPTIDIDFVGDDIHPNELHKTIMQIAKQMKVHVEPVPLDRFVPLPDGNAEREIRIGQYGNLEIHVADPYSIALSKVDRGADTDLEDVVFLVENKFIEPTEFENIVRNSLANAGMFDLNPEILDHLQELKKRLK